MSLNFYIHGILLNQREFNSFFIPIFFKINRILLVLQTFAASLVIVY